MASTSAMTPTNDITVYRDWEGVFDQHFEILKDAVKRGDYTLVTALEVQARLSNIDHDATLDAAIRDLPPSILDDGEVKEVVENLEETLEEANKASKKNCDEVKQSMEKRAKQSADDADAWEREFDKDMDVLKEKTIKELDGVRDLGKAEIKKLPRTCQNSVAAAYKRGANAVSGFISKAISWIGDALAAIGEFIRNIALGITRFAQRTLAWFQGALTEIEKAFTKPVVAKLALTKKAIRGDATGSFAAFEDLAKQLQNLGLENFTLARKGNSWVIETM